MTLQVDYERLSLAHKAIQAELMAERARGGRWPGEVSSSPLATATAVSALVLAHETDAGMALVETSAGETGLDSLLQTDLSELLVQALHWLARFQNQDGGWGDATGGRSNLTATLLVQAAFRLTGLPAKYTGLKERADQFVALRGGIPDVRYHLGRERLAAAPILANCALARMLPWRQVPALPFELACVPRGWAEAMRLPLAAVELPALVAVGQAKFRHDPPRNPLSRVLRQASRVPSLSLLGRTQADDGSFWGNIPLTAFVVMCIATSGGQRHPIVQRGVEFLLSMMRSDASWPIVADLAVRNTTQAIDALAAAAATGGSPVGISRGQRSRPADPVDRPAGASVNGAPPDPIDPDCLKWLLDAQCTQSDLALGRHAGGWGWNDQPGTLPATDDTAGVLLVLAMWRNRARESHIERLERAARQGILWLLDAQNDDGGWPAFRGARGALGFHRSAADITAHVVRALAAWRRIWQPEDSASPKRKQRHPHFRINAAIDRALSYLATNGRGDGSFVGVRFGNQHQADAHNPVCGTARVLMMCADTGRLESEMAARAVRWLLSAQHTEGGWGPPRTPLDYSGAAKNGAPARRENLALAVHVSVEETALAVAALMPMAIHNSAAAQAASRGLEWLISAVEEDRHRHPAVIGLLFTTLWYHERMDPVALTAKALAAAVRQLAPNPPLASLIR